MKPHLVNNNFMWDVTPRLGLHSTGNRYATS